MVTQVVVQKGQRRMYLLNNQTFLKPYDFGLSDQPVGHKQFEGDGKMPDGLFFVDRFNPRSRYQLSVGIAYPNERDMAYSAQFDRNAGNDIMSTGGVLRAAFLPGRTETGDRLDCRISRRSARRRPFHGAEP